MVSETSEIFGYKKITTWQKVNIILLFSCKFIDLTVIANKSVMSPNVYYTQNNSIFVITLLLLGGTFSFLIRCQFQFW